MAKELKRQRTALRRRRTKMLMKVIILAATMVAVGAWSTILTR